MRSTETRFVTLTDRLRCASCVEGVGGWSGAHLVMSQRIETVSEKSILKETPSSPPRANYMASISGMGRGTWKSPRLYWGPLVPISYCLRHVIIHGSISSEGFSSPPVVEQSVLAVKWTFVHILRLITLCYVSGCVECYNRKTN